MKKIILILSILTLICNSTNSKVLSKNSIKPIDREAWLPLDFDPNNTVLLIEKWTYINKKGKDVMAKETKQLEEVMKKNYPYPYELVERSNRDTIYSDYKKYPYMLIFKSQYNEYNSPGHIVSGITGQTCMLLYRDRGATVYTNYWAYSFKKGILEATVKQMVEIYKKRTNK